jgi:tripartite-type tricarboxylate transporter receptor subunit TctC
MNKTRHAEHGSKAASSLWSAARKPVSLLLAAVLFCAISTAGRAETYPSRTITIVVGFAPGGLIDVVARLVGQKLQEKLGQTVIVENRPGAAGNIAHRRVANAEPDGYMILAATTSLAINETLYPKRGYTADQFKALSISARSPEMITAPAAGAKSLKEYLDNARVNGAQFGTAGAGSASYIVTQYFMDKLAKVKATHIPYQGGAPAIAAALGNQIPLVAAPPAAGLVPPIKAGSLRGLALASDKRLAILPDVPTYQELGYSGLIASAWTGFFVPAKTPDDIAQKLNGAINDILREPEIVERLQQIGFEPLTQDLAQTNAMFREEIANWRTMVDAIQLKVE